MPTFTSYWQNEKDGQSVRGHQARLIALETALIKKGWDRTENGECDLAIFDVYDQYFGTQMLSTSFARVHVWIGNRTAQNLGQVLLKTKVDIYADQDWGVTDIIDMGNDKFIVCAPMVDEDFLNKMKSSLDKGAKESGNHVVLIPGGNKLRFMQQIIAQFPLYWNEDEVVIAEEMPRKELMELCWTANKVYCTPSVVAMELATLGIDAEYIVTSPDQVGNFLNRSASIRGFEGGANYLASFINKYYHYKETQ